MQSKPDVITQMIDQALEPGLQADFVLMDSWFTEVPLIESLCEKGLDVIGMVKRSRRFKYQDQLLTLKELYSRLKKGMGKHDIHGSFQVQLSSGRRVKIVFVRNRNKPSEWLTLLSTDITLADDEIIHLYGRRWQIETFFKQCKSQLIEIIKTALDNTKGRSATFLKDQVTQWFSQLPIYQGHIA